MFLNLVTFFSNDLLDFMCHPVKLSLVLLFFMILLPYFYNGKKPSRKVYLLDFACYKGNETQLHTREMAIEMFRVYQKCSDETLEFVQKLLERTGLGDSAYFPESMMKNPPNPCLEEARKEAEDVMFRAIDDVFAKTGLRGEDIGIVVVNCSVFNVVPSLSDMIVNRYKLGDDVLTYNLGGMGCSAGLVAIGLAKQLLQVHPNTYALMISTENLTENFYMGKNHSMIIANTLFRLGGAAIILSNRPSERHTSKYQLIDTVLTYMASHDRSYNSISVEEDEEGQRGISINKDLMIAAIKAIESNVATLARLVLPVSEQIKYLMNYIIRYLHLAEIKPYVPNLGKQFDHFFPHVGGKPVLDELQKKLRFSDTQMEASRMTLYRFGNTSSSSVWYEMAYAEAKGRVKRGNCLWQIAFGSGFKCSSAVWRALRTIDFEEKNPWSDEINKFPVDVSKIEVGPVQFEPSKET